MIDACTMNDDQLQELLASNASEKQLKDKFEVFFSHYDAPDLPPKIAVGNSKNWLRAFQIYPIRVVDEACQEWLKNTSPYPPTIGQLREICDRLVRKAEREIARRTSRTSINPKQRSSPPNGTINLISKTMTKIGKPAEPT